jgi:Extensin-like protein C-terminus
VNVAKDWREALRTSTCARFSTVLGPGSDGYHEEHIHLDLAERRGGYKMCQWGVREPIAPPQTTEPQSAQNTARIEDPVPLPRPRQAANIRSKPIQIHPPFR